MNDRLKRYVAFWSEEEAPEALALLRITFGLALLAQALEPFVTGMLLPCYADVSSGGAFSVRAVPIMGLCLMTLRAAALFSSAQWGNVFMAAGFGLVQMGFGLWIALKYGG